MKQEHLITGLSIGGALILIYVIYKAIGDYKTSKRIENIDKSLAKLSDTKPWENKFLDKITLKEATEKLGKRINNNFI